MVISTLVYVNSKMLLIIRQCVNVLLFVVVYIVLKTPVLKPGHQIIMRYVLRI